MENSGPHIYLPNLLGNDTVSMGNRGGSLADQFPTLTFHLFVQYWKCRDQKTFLL